MENNISTILVLPHTPAYCIYYINNGERHLASYDKIKEIIKTISSKISNMCVYYFDRKLPFIIDIENSSVIEVSPKDDSIEIRKSFINYKNINISDTDNSIKFKNSQDKMQKLFANLSKKT